MRQRQKWAISGTNDALRTFVGIYLKIVLILYTIGSRLTDTDELHNPTAYLTKN